MIKSLYISYNGMTEPIVKSQVIPYLRELSKKDIKFYLLTFEKVKLTKDEKLSIKNKIKKETGIEWFSLSYHKKPTVPATIFDIMMGIFYSLIIVLRHNVDVIHARAITSALIGYPIAKLFFKKFIFDTRGIDSEEYVDAGTWRRGGIKHRMVSFAEKVLVGTSDWVIVLTERFLKILQNNQKDKKINFTVIPCAVDTNRFSPAQEEKFPPGLNLKGKFIISYIGSLGTWYMLDEMIDFFKVLKENIENAHFLILTQSDKNFVRKILKDKNLNENDFTLSSVEHDKVPEYLSFCKVGIFFIRPMFSKLSSSPTKFGEYLSSGLPVVINHDIGDTDVITEKNKVGVVINGFNTKDYHVAVSELKNLLNDKNIALRCRQTAEKKLSLSSAVSSYHNVYRKLFNVE